MLSRDAERTLRRLAAQFKAIALVGPRQTGKTTLARHVFGDRPYVSMENPDNLRFATEDPRGFLATYKDGAVFDEAQRTPDLFSWLQGILDEELRPGRFILTGSNNFLLQQNISQSLAGRIAYLFLLPFSISELSKAGKLPASANELLIDGGYPPIYDQPVEPGAWYSNYIHTYVQRDVRQIRNITDLAAFERLLRLCAGRIGQLLNVHSLSIEAGVDAKTIAAWLGVLESSFVLFRLYPHHRNYNKRVVKMPKLYFHDTGLACRLLGIQSAGDLFQHYARGALFENLIVSELKKARFNQGYRDNLYFWRDNTGHEVDVVLDQGDDLFPIEIKAGQTIIPDFFKGLSFFEKLTGRAGGAVVYAGKTPQQRSDGVSVVPWSNAGHGFTTI